MEKTMNKIEKNNKHKTMLIIILLLALSFLIMAITFGLSTATLNSSLYKSYLKSPLLMLMNYIPILLFMAFIYLISNKLWLSYSITSFLFVAMGIINKLKLTYRDDPFIFMDIKLFGESVEMTGRYDVSLSPKIITMIIGLIIIGVVLKLFFNFKINSKKTRLRLILSMVIISTIIFNGFYFDPKVYAKIGDESQINKWIASQQFQSKGFVYPFIYSIQEAREKEPEGYNEGQAKNELFKYEYKNIAEDKKVNIISIMLEAYNDFSKFEDVELNTDIYENFHKIQEESLSGNLITNVFAGGTINTERAFLTGYYHHPKYKCKTNSFVWYLNEQGYKTEAMHPITGSFYDRRNGNEYLGFDNFDHYDNKYQEVQEDYLKDIDFFDFIIKGHENSVKKGIPYFNFTVTYQNHGPYSDEKIIEEEYLKRKENYNEADYNIINNYMSGINETDKALKKLFDHFRSSQEPTVVVIFGDHNPWLGKDNSVYDMLDINMDLGTTDGFKNYYETPYVIWGNEAAKETLDRDFIGEGKTISPNHLMPELFDYIGWEGNEYMQYLIDLKKILPINHELYFEENNQLTPVDNISSETKKLWEDFVKVEYYTKTNFFGK